MTDNEIIRALECCIEDDCDNCPWDEQTACIEYMKRDALYLIDSQKAEIERLKEQIGEYPFKCKVGSNSEIHSKSIEDYDSLIGDISAQATKEFAERLKEEQEFHVDECDNFVGFVAVSRIDNILKEMGVEE